MNCCPWAALDLRRLLCWSLCALAWAAPAQTNPITLGPVSYAPVVPGLDYAHIVDRAMPWSIHVVRLTRGQPGFRVISTLGQGQIYGLAGLSRQLAALPAGGGKPVFALNGDFFEIQPGPYQGDPEGLQVVDGEVVSAPSQRAFWVDAAGEPHIGMVRSQFEVRWPDGTRTPFGLNQAPATNRATLFTGAFADFTHATNLAELVLSPLPENPAGLRLGETYRMRVVAQNAEGNSALASNHWVLTLSGSAATNLAAVRIGDGLTLTTGISTNIPNPVTAVGGGPFLVHQGELQPWPAKKGLMDYLQPRHPRSAVGFDEKHLYFVAVDGRQAGLSVGMSFVELSSLMIQLGCREALNLDGGGSTTFWLNGKVMNSPSDKRERGIANALVVVQEGK